MPQPRSNKIVTSAHNGDVTASARSNRHRRPTFRDGLRLGIAQGNVVGGLVVSVVAIRFDAVLLAFLGGCALTLGLHMWEHLDWRWKP